MGLMIDNVDIETTYGVIIDGASSWGKPSRNREFITVPGRNGDLIIDNGNYNNVIITYNCYFRSGWQTNYEAFTAWLYSHTGYFRLEDSARHPGVYRMASLPDEMEPELWFLNDVGTFTLDFICKPQQWLTSGETPISIQLSNSGDGGISTGSEDTSFYTSALTYTGMTVNVDFVTTGESQSATVATVDVLEKATGVVTTKTATIAAGESDTISISITNADFANVELQIAVNYDSTAVSEAHLSASSIIAELMLTNPTQYPARPTITIKGSERSELKEYYLFSQYGTKAGFRAEIPAGGDPDYTKNEIIVDSENGVQYINVPWYESIYPYITDITTEYFPVIGAGGRSEIYPGYGRYINFAMLEEIEIVPNWWRI